MFTWNADMIRFMLDAAAENGYYDEIARRMAAHLPPDAHVCDAGCGLGLLSLALSPYCRQITAVDISAEPIRVLERLVRERGVQNVTPVCADIHAMHPETPYDALVCCFFGTTEEMLHLGKAQCSGQVFQLKKNWTHHRFSLTAQPLKRFTTSETVQCLTRYGIPYETETFDVETGQPFRTVQDAVRFFEIYSRDDGAPSLEAVRDRLQQRPDPVFPYYLPSPKTLCMISLRAGDIPDDIRLPAPE